MSLRTLFTTKEGTAVSFTVHNVMKHIVLILDLGILGLLLLSNPVAGPILTYNSSTDCFPNGEILFCSFTDQYFSFYMCPENYFWTKQFKTTDNSSINGTGNLICKNCPSGTSNSKTHHWDTECYMPSNSARSSVSPSTKSCFTQWDYLRCQTGSGDWTDFVICTEDQRWTGKMINSQLECVKCPSDMHNPYKYHFNTTCISARKESSSESTNSIPGFQSNFWSILISFGLALLF